MSKLNAVQVTQSEILCYLGCNLPAKFMFRNGKYCCSAHFNSCPAKRERFSKLVDHSSYTKKSLETRIKKGITKSSQIKGAKTRKESGFYKRHSEHMKSVWEKTQWNTNPKWRNYKDTEVLIQSSYEHNFLQNLENLYGLEWIKNNVSRGPCFWYVDPISNKKRLYISDFKINDIIYEIKGDYTWDRLGKDCELKQNNIAKLNAASQDYEVVLVLEGKHIQWKK